MTPGSACNLGSTSAGPSVTASALQRSPRASAHLPQVPLVRGGHYNRLLLVKLVLRRIQRLHRGGEVMHIPIHPHMQG